jgi:hypothetical protein
MKKVSGRALLDCVRFEQLGDNRAEAEKEANETKMREADSKKWGLRNGIRARLSSWQIRKPRLADKTMES